MPASHAVRRQRLTELVREQQLDALLVTNLINVRYLTGFTGSNGALLLGADGSATFATDGRYTTQSEEQCPDLERVIDRTIASTLAKRASGKLGFEAQNVTVATFDSLSEHADLHRTKELVEQLRRVKDEEEIELLRQAAAAADRAFAELLANLRPGRTEKEVGRELDARMFEHGADELSFETIVAAGPNGAMPHHRPGDRPIERGDLIVFDFGAAIGGYHSDMTRTVMLGEPADWQREIYELVRDSQRVGQEALAPGADPADVDAAARQVIVDAGHGEHFTHGLGHGVGLEIHEAPSLGPRGVTYTPSTLEVGMPVTVEPGVYLPGRGGVRIEDTLVVRDGEPDLLTTTTKDLLVL